MMVAQSVELSQLSSIPLPELAQMGVGRGQSPSCGLRDALQLGCNAGRQIGCPLACQSPDCELSSPLAISWALHIPIPISAGGAKPPIAQTCPGAGDEKCWQRRWYPPNPPHLG